MNILVITASLPYPPASGGALRVYGLLRGLADAGHCVALLAFGDPDAPTPEPLRAACAEIIVVPPPPPRTKTARLRALLLTRQPDIAARLTSDAMAEALRALLARERFDLIQIEAIEAAPYLALAKAHARGARLVFDTFNAEYLLQRAAWMIDRRRPRRWPAALYSWIQSRRIARYERDLCALADAVIAVSPEDADALRAFRPDRVVHIVPSGIFTADYARPPSADAPGDGLVFTGKMDYRPNIDAMLWFASDILPAIRRARPDAHLRVVGQSPDARLVPLRADPAITLTGWVDSVLPYLHEAAVYIAPLRMGSGTRLKLLEAMAAGCAIVATPAAAAGLTEPVRAAMCLADDAGTFAARVIELLDDPARRRALGEAAVEAVRATYDWSAITPRLLAVYAALNGGTHRGGMDR